MVSELTNQQPDPPPLSPEERHRRIRGAESVLCAALSAIMGHQPHEHFTAGCMAVLSRILVVTALEAKIPGEQLLRSINAAYVAMSEGRLVVSTRTPGAPA